jgi:rhodanese-related sulfurtransferase
MKIMKKIVLFILVILMAATQVLGAEKDIVSRDAKLLLDTNKNIFLLDVRTPQEYSQGRLAGSVLIPIDELERRTNEVPRNKTVLVYCAVGSRSSIAKDVLTRHGFKDILNMSDGIVGWYRNGFPVKR